VSNEDEPRVSMSQRTATVMCVEPWPMAGDGGQELPSGGYGGAILQ
jgi:hypothetical protein